MKNYLVRVERAGNNFSGYLPELLGCVASGETIEELKENMHTAVAWHIQALQQDGQTIEEPGELAFELVNESTSSPRAESPTESE